MQRYIESALGLTSQASFLRLKLVLQLQAVNPPDLGVPASISGAVWAHCCSHHCQFLLLLAHLQAASYVEEALRLKMAEKKWLQVYGLCKGTQLEVEWVINKDSLVSWAHSVLSGGAQ
jgi:hypothetical protein